MVDRDVVLTKVESIRRCVHRIESVHDPERGLDALDVEELVTLNLQRATQSVIDLAAHIVATKGWGMPDTVAENFRLLERNGLIDAEMTHRLRAMVGFRNIAVHEYEMIDPEIVEAIVEKHLGDLGEFGRIVLQYFGFEI